MIPYDQREVHVPQKTSDLGNSVITWGFGAGSLYHQFFKPVPEKPQQDYRKQTQNPPLGVPMYLQVGLLAKKRLIYGNKDTISVCDRFRLIGSAINDETYFD